MINKDGLMQDIKRGCSSNDNIEKAFREKVVIRIIEHLGWNTDEDVIFEKSMRIGTVTHNVDYFIKSQNSSFILEAKAPTVEVETERFFEEVTSYMGVLHIKYGILYNGKKLFVFNNKNNDPVFEWDCSQNNDIFLSLAKDNFPQSLEEFLNKYEETRKIKEYVDDNLEEIKNKILGTIINGSKTSEEIVTQYLPIIINRLNERYGTTKSEIFKKEETSGEPYFIDSEEKVNDEKSQMKRTGIKPTVSRIIREGVKRSGRLSPVSISLNGEVINIDKSNQILINTAEWLVSKGKINKSIKFESGPQRWLISSEPIHRNGKSFFVPYRLSNGLFLELHYSSTTIEKLAKSLMKRFGYPEDSIYIRWKK